ncbi:uncharacterized protein LOC141855682 [Brevipalpus obovatus]|uniref:uncharacterized protein LOC141855682 n=1 Tax=Brevipalpus obovatus TaxID=246614 RepID=UPI003D9DED1D
MKFLKRVRWLEKRIKRVIKHKDVRVVQGKDLNSSTKLKDIRIALRTNTSGGDPNNVNVVVDNDESRLLANVENIEPDQLYDLINRIKSDPLSSEFVLLLDVRKNDHYNRSHIDNLKSDRIKLVCIPEELVEADMASAKLLRALPLPAQNTLHERHRATKMIIFNWNSKLPLDDVYLKTVYNCFGKWDTSKDRCLVSPIIMNGGYCGWLESYPFLTNDPTRLARETSKSSSSSSDEKSPGKEYSSSAKELTSSSTTDPVCKKQSTTDTPVHRPSKKDEEVVHKKIDEINGYDEVDAKKLPSSKSPIPSTKRRDLFEPPSSIGGSKTSTSTKTCITSSSIKIKHSPTLSPPYLSGSSSLPSSSSPSSSSSSSSSGTCCDCEAQLEEFNNRGNRLTNNTSIRIPGGAQTIPGTLNRGIREIQCLKSPNHVESSPTYHSPSRNGTSFVNGFRENTTTQSKIFGPNDSTRNMLNGDDKAQNKSQDSTKSPSSPNRSPKLNHETSSSHSGASTPIENDPGQLNSVQSGALTLGTGLKNLGNTCFMNAVLQCLADTVELRRYFLDQKHISDINRSNRLGSGGALAEALGVLIQDIRCNHMKTFSPVVFKDAVVNHMPSFVGGEQQDAHEFFCMLLEKLHADLNRAKRDLSSGLFIEPDDNPAHIAINKFWTHHTSHSQSIVAELFEGLLMSSLKCTVCNKQSNTFEVFTNLSLPIPTSMEGECTLAHCLDLFTDEERLTGEAAWRCPSCKTKRDAIKRIRICKLPKILVIHLNRFSYEGKLREKIQNVVEFPLTDLNLKNNVISSLNDPTEPVFDLYGVVNHNGTLEGGHYVAFSKNEENKWYGYDDHEVTESSEEDVKSRAAYLLFYTAKS